MKLLLNVLFVLALLGLVVLAYTLLFPFAAFIVACVILTSLAGHMLDEKRKK